MAKVVMYQCDVCGATKGASNHWWIAVIAPDDAFIVSPFSEFKIHDRSILCCGQKCLLTKLNEWIEWKLRV